MKKRTYFSPESNVIDIKFENALLNNSESSSTIEDWGNGDIILNC